MERPPNPAQKPLRNPYKPSATNITYLLALILLAGWAVGLFGFHAGNEIHLLLVMAMTVVIANIIRGV